MNEGHDIRYATYDIRIYMRRLSRMRILIRLCYVNFNR